MQQINPYFEGIGLTGILIILWICLIFMEIF